MVPRPNEQVQLYQYQRHVFGAAMSLTCVFYAFKPVGLDNEEMYLVAAKQYKRTSTWTISTNQ